MPVTVERARRVILFYGAVLLLGGIVTGVPFAMAIRYGWGDDVARAWRVAHTSMLTGGLLYLGVAAVVDRLVVGAKALRVLVRSAVVAAWALLVVVPVGALVGERGLVLGESVVGTLVSLGFVVMGVSITVFVITLTVGAWAALRAPE